MSKLHEILAVSGDLATTAKNINDEAITTFSKKPELFTKTVTSLVHLNEDDKPLDTVEHSDMVTTVYEKLKYIVRANARAADAYYQKEATNQQASADLTIDGVVIETKVPATVLLGLETKLADLRKVYASIPTLAPGPTWVLDPAEPAGVYKSEHAEKRVRTRKNVRPVVLVPPTQFHPAQVQAINEDLPIGTISVTKWSGMMSSAQKSELLDRLDKLVRAVKRARQRANEQKLDERHIGQKLFDYLHTGIVT